MDPLCKTRLVEIVYKFIDSPMKLSSVCAGLKRQMIVAGREPKEAKMMVNAAVREARQEAFREGRKSAWAR